MLPSLRSDTSDFDIDAPAKLKGIEELIERRERVFGALSDLLRVQEALVGGFGVIVDLDDVGANTLLALKLRGG